MTHLPPSGTAGPLRLEDDDWEKQADRPTIWFASPHEEHVLALQKQLAKIGIPIADETPGKFGPQTDQAVRAFQEQSGINADGIVDAVTWLNLFAAEIPDDE